jgi:hypothetical protein
MLSLFKLYADVRPLAESRTAKYFKAQGASFPETMSLFGTYGGGDYGWDRKGQDISYVKSPYVKSMWNQGPELTALMLDHWDYTMNEAFLKEQVLPMAESVLRYFDTRFKKDDKGKVVVDPTQALETYWHGVVNDTPTVAGLVNITRRLTELSPVLTTPGQRTFFEKMRAACPLIPMEVRDGQREVSVAEKFNPNASNCENPKTYAIWPYREISLSRPELLAEGKATYAHRGLNLPNGWGYDSNSAALLGMTEEAAHILQGKCANSNNRYRWPATWGPNYDWLPDQNHGGNLMETTNLMLLQGEIGGKILVLPAWPPQWDVNFKLHAPQQTTVACEVRNGKITRLVVTPESRRKDVRICAPFTL